MRALVQRVLSAEVEVDGKVVGSTEKGLLVYLGVALTDTAAQAVKMADKVANLRIFDDESGKLNLSVLDVHGGALVISNFTLLGDARKGRRPEYTAAAPGPTAEPIYEAFATELARLGCPAGRGQFGAAMAIRSQADGPVNIVIDLDAPGSQ